MSRIRYTPFFSLKIYHSYFKENKCDCLNLTPTKATQELMKRFGFFLAQENYGWVLVGSQDSHSSKFLKNLKNIAGQPCLEFVITTRDPDFYIYTDLPLNWTGFILYDSQSSSNQIKDDTIHLHPKLIEKSSSASLATVKIYFADLLHLFNESIKASFDIQYKARPTQWQYYIVNTHHIPLNEPQIVSKSSYSFSGPKSVQLQDGQKALLFSSANQLISLSKVPQYHFDLVSRSNLSQDPQGGNKKLKIVRKGLPNPDTKNLGIVTVKGKKTLSSPIYVYI